MSGKGKPDDTNGVDHEPVSERERIEAEATRLRLEGNLDAADQYYRQLEALGGDLNVADANHGLALTHRNRATKALQSGNSIEFRREYHRFHSYLISAEAFEIQAFKAYEAAGDYLRASDALLGKGLILQQRGHYEEASSTILESISYLEQKADLGLVEQGPEYYSHISIKLARLAETFGPVDDPDRMQYFLEKANEYPQLNSNWRVRIEEVRGDLCAVSEGQTGLALAWYQVATQGAEGMGDRYRVDHIRPKLDRLLEDVELPEREELPEVDPEVVRLKEAAKQKRVAGDLAGASSDYEKLLEDNPLDPDIESYVNHHLALIARNRASVAAREGDTTLERNFLLRAQDYEKKAATAAVQSKSPEAPIAEAEAAIGQALIWQELGEPARAIDIAHGAIARLGSLVDVVPDKPHYYEHLGSLHTRLAELYLKAGNFEKAGEYLRHSFKIPQQNPSFRIKREEVAGDYQLAVGRPKLAEGWYRVALAGAQAIGDSYRARAVEGKIRDLVGPGVG